MKAISCTFFLVIVLHYSPCCQGGEMDKFYSYYKVDIKSKKLCDSVYNLIEQRRSAFSKEFSAYKEKNDGPKGFIYDWSLDEKNILPALETIAPECLRHLIYYSYFDLGYGVYGLHLNPEVCQQALKEIQPNSVIWAMEPSLLEAVIRHAGGEDKYTIFIKKLLKENKDANLIDFVNKSLSPDRPLKVDKYLPELRFRSYSDTMKFLTTNTFKGKYLLIDIWASWCKPCIDEFPGLQKAYQNKNDKLDFLSISIDNDVITSIKFLENRFPFPWQKGAAVNRMDIMNTLMINGIPCTILISPDGKILSYGYPLRGESLEKTLQAKIK